MTSMFSGAFDLPEDIPATRPPTSRQVRALRALDWLRPRIPTPGVVAQLSSILAFWNEASGPIECAAEMSALLQQCERDPIWNDAAVEVAHAACGIRPNDLRSRSRCDGPSRSFITQVNAQLRAFQDRRYADALSDHETYLGEESYAMGMGAGARKQAILVWLQTHAETAAVLRINPNFTLSFDARRVLMCSRSGGGLQWHDRSGSMVAHGCPAYGWDGSAWRMLGLHLRPAPAETLSVTPRCGARPIK